MLGRLAADLGAVPVVLPRGGRRRGLRAYDAARRLAPAAEGDRPDQHVRHARLLGAATSGAAAAAPGALEGPGKRVLPKRASRRSNAAKGSKCLWRRSPCTGLEVEGVGQLHKGFCHQQWTAEEEKRKCVPPTAACPHRPACPPHLPPASHPNAGEAARGAAARVHLRHLLQADHRQYYLLADDGAPPGARAQGARGVLGGHTCVHCGLRRLRNTTTWPRAASHRVLGGVARQPRAQVPAVRPPRVGQAPPSTAAASVECWESWQLARAPPTRASSAASRSSRSTTRSPREGPPQWAAYRETKQRDMSIVDEGDETAPAAARRLGAHGPLAEAEAAEEADAFLRCTRCARRRRRGGRCRRQRRGRDAARRARRRRPRMVLQAGAGGKVVEAAMGGGARRLPLPR